MACLNNDHNGNTYTQVILSGHSGLIHEEPQSFQFGNTHSYNVFWKLLVI